MPEGPTMIIAKEQLQHMVGQRVSDCEGYISTFDKQLLVQQKLVAVKSWGKQLILCFENINLRIHLLLFGKYSIGQPIRAKAALHLVFPKQEVFFYSSSIHPIEGNLDEAFDWPADIMSDAWDAGKAKQKLAEKESPVMACDALLDQEIFSGAGNIIKNEVLWRQKIHPESDIANINGRRLSALVKDVREYSFLFLDWKRKDELVNHLQVHKQKDCPRCKTPLTIGNRGKLKRKAYFCNNCQEKY